MNTVAGHRSAGAAVVVAPHWQIAGGCALVSAVPGPGSARPRVIRVLVVDDSAVIRKLIARVLDAEPDIEVAGQAANGREALDIVGVVRPDLVTLDVEMPVLDGLMTIKALRSRWPRLPVIMCSTLTEGGARTTLEALSSGASDYVTKPSGGGGASLTEQLGNLRVQLVPKVRALTAPRSADVVAAPAPPAPPAAANPALTVAGEDPAPVVPVVPPRPGGLGMFRPSRPGAPVPPQRSGIGAPVGRTDALLRPALPAPAVPASPASGAPARPRAAGGAGAHMIVIGVSTGGPNALAEVIPALPADLGVPVVVVQHMPPVFTRMLAERLDGRSALHVVEAEQGMPLLAGGVYIAPGDFHLSVTGSIGELRARLDQSPPENSCRPAVDVLFRSAAAVCGPRLVGAIMTGMGADGHAGSEAIVAAGGTVFAQDEATSVVWGMPGLIARSGLAREVVPLDRMAATLVAARGGLPRARTA
jgi:two-component system, chemotaxis family, protein-glutamate methylesterase/glutaminase